MAVRHDQGEGTNGYGHSVQAASRQRKGRALYRIVVFLAILFIFGLLFASILAWVIFADGSSLSPLVLYVVLLCLGLCSALLVRLFRHLQEEDRRLNKLEDREVQLQLFAERHALATDMGELNLHITPKQEAENFDNMMSRLDGVSQDGKSLQSAPRAIEGEGAEEFLGEAFSHVGVLVQHLNRLLHLIRDKFQLASTKSLSQALQRELPSGELVSPQPPDDKNTFPESDKNKE